MNISEKAIAEIGQQQSATDRGVDSVITELKRLGCRMDTSMSKDSATTGPFDDKLQTSCDDLSKQIKILTWVVSIAMAISIFIIARK